MANQFAPGTYDELVIIGTDVEPGKGEDEAVIVIKLTTPEEADDASPTTLWHRIYLTDKAKKRATKTLRAYGWDPDANDWDFSVFVADGDPDENPLLGKTVGPVIVELESYTSKTGETKVSPKVKQIGNTAFGFGIGSSEAKALAARFQKRMRLINAQSYADGLPGVPPSTPKPAAADPDF